MKSNKRKLVGAFLGMAISVATFSGAMANDEKYLNSDPININGYVQEEAIVSDAELETVKNEIRKQKTAIIVNKEKKKSYNKLSKSTEKLADITEEMIEERKESQITIDKYNKKIDCLMAQGFKEGCEEFVKAPKEDKVEMVQAAPQVIEAPIVLPTSGDKFGESIKVMPYSGLTTFITDNEKLEAGLVGGVKVETNVNARFSVGMGFNYTSFTTEDYGNNNNYFSNYNNNNIYGYNYGQQYNSYYGGGNSTYGGREIEFKNMNIDIYSKFYIIENNRFRPYIGAGLGYNRTTLAYSNNSSPSTNYGGAYNNYSFGNEEVLTSNIDIELMLGSEVKFTDSIGANLEISYKRGIGGNISSKNGQNNYLAPDQQRLEDLSAELGEANIVSLFAGLVVEF